MTITSTTFSSKSQFFIFLCQINKSFDMTRDRFGCRANVRHSDLTKADGGTANLITLQRDDYLVRKRSRNKC